MVGFIMGEARRRFCEKGKPEKGCRQENYQ
jgi:hypothetical protein